jgi:hypothetical protein
MHWVLSWLRCKREGSLAAVQDFQPELQGPWWCGLKQVGLLLRSRQRYACQQNKLAPHTAESRCMSAVQLSDACRAAQTSVSFLRCSIAALSASSAATLHSCI